MDKKQKTMIGSILAILLIIAVLAGYTLAKYYSSYDGRGNLEIAKWNFKVDGWTEEDTNEISLIETLDYEDRVDLEEGKIAPGFDGKVELQLDATDSEVDVEYYIEATENGHKPSNLVFYAEMAGEETKTYATLEELALKELKGTILKTDSNKVENIVIHCTWPYETGTDDASILKEDGEDTAAGTGSVEGQENVFDYSFSLKIVGTQAKATN